MRLLTEATRVIGSSLRRVHVILIVLTSVISIWIALARFDSTRATVLEQIPHSTTTCPVFLETQPILEERERLAAAVVNVGGQDFIYAVGGQTPSKRITNTVFYAKVFPSGATDDWQKRDNAFGDAVFRHHALVSANGRLYLLGGDDAMGVSQLVYKTQPEPETAYTTWSTTTPLRVPVYLHAAVHLAGRIYVIGGHLPEISSITAAVFSAEIRPNGDLSRWDSESSLEELAPGGIWGHTAVASEEHQCIYVIGGWIGPLSQRGAHNRVFRACVEGNDRLSDWGVEPEALPLVPGNAEGIYYHSAAIVDDRVFVIGGAAYTPPSVESTDSVYIGDIVDGHLGNWTACTHCLPGVLERQATAVGSNGMIYIIGGTDRSFDEPYDAVLFTPLIDVKKLATPSGPLTCDDTISYELKLTNLGVRDLEHLTISDTIQTSVSTAIQSLPDECQYNHETITCDVLSLPLGQTKSLTYSITISPSTSVESRLFLQTPQVDVPKDAFAQQDRSAGILEPSGIADLSLEKSGIASLAVAGREFTYTLLINNLGPTTADNVVVVDNLPNGVAFRRASPSPSITGTNSLTWSLGSILDDESREIQFVVEVASSSSDALINTASVSSSDSDPNPDNNQDAVWTYIVQEADLSIDKADYPDPVIAGEVLTYTLAITNAGPSDAHDVCVEDLLPSDDLVVITTTPGTPIGTNPLVWCDLDLLAGQKKGITIVTTINSQSEGTIRNTAVLDSDIDTSPGNIVTELTAIHRLADLHVEKIESSDPITPGAVLTYTLLITNAGPSAATQVVLTDTLPPEVCGITGPLPPQCSGSPLVCDLGTMPPGGREEIPIAVIVCLTSTGVLVNEAEVSSDVPDSDPWDNRCEERTGIRRVADLALGGNRDPDLVIAGTAVAYTLQVNNGGPWSAVNVTISDSLPVGMHFITATLPFTVTVITTTPPITVVTWYTPALVPDQSWELQLVARVDPSFTSTLTNTAVVASSTPDNYPNNNWYRDGPYHVYRLADLSVRKEGKPSSIGPGAVLTYTLLITNTGPSAATNAIVVDTLPSGVCGTVDPLPPQCDGDPLICDLDTMPPGERKEILIAVTVCPTSTGVLVNEAEVSSDVLDLYPWDNSDWEETPVVSVDLHLEKSHYPNVATAGNLLTYTLTVINGGPSDALTVTLSDSLPVGMHFITATLPFTVTVITTTPPITVVTWHTPALVLDQSWELQLVARVDPSVTSTLTNTAVVTSSTQASHPEGITITDPVSIITSADLRVEKEGKPSPVARGGTLVYTLRVINEGPSDARDVVLSDILPPDVIVPSAFGGVSPSGLSPLVWHRDLLKANDVWTTSVTTVVTPAAKCLLVNTARANSGTPDPNPSNNRGEEQTLVSGSVINQVRVCEGTLWCKEGNWVFTIVNPIDGYLPVLLREQ